MAEIGGFISLFPVAPDDIRFDENRHSSRVPAGLGRTFLQLTVVLLPGFAIGEQSVALLSRASIAFSGRASCFIGR